jgi:hypothetical protein
VLQTPSAAGFLQQPRWRMPCLTTPVDAFAGRCGSIAAAPYRVGICHCMDCRKRQGRNLPQLRSLPSGCGDGAALFETLPSVSLPRIEV